MHNWHMMHKLGNRVMLLLAAVRRAQRLHQMTAVSDRCYGNAPASVTSFRSHCLSPFQYAAAMLSSRDRRHIDDVITTPGRAAYTRILCAFTARNIRINLQHEL